MRSASTPPAATPAGSPAPAAPERVYTDSPLTSSMAYAGRLLTADARNTLVLPPQDSPQDLMVLSTILVELKQNGKLPSDKLGHKVIQDLIKAGLIDNTGNARSGLQDLLKRNPRIEFILKVAEEQYAAMVFTQGGMAYIDPTGAACPDVLVPFPTEKDREHKESFSKVLPGGWLQFYGVPREKAEERVKDVHIHQGIKLYDGEKAMSLDGVLTSLDVLQRNIAAGKEDFEKGKKLSRADLVKAINGKPNLIDPGQNFKLRYLNERKDEAKLKAWEQRVEEIQDRRDQLTKEVKKDIKAGRLDPGTSTRARVTIERQPEYRKTNALNTYETVDEKGITNTIEQKDDRIIATSEKGKVTYYQRFLSLAQDIDATLRDAHGDIQLPVVINSVEPAERDKECRQAFKDFFGPDNVLFKDAADDAPDAVVARVPRAA